jgi:hypothetical protein
MQTSGGLGPNRAAGRQHQGAVIAGIFLATLVIHVLSPVTTSTDSAWTIHVAASILREGNVNLDEYRSLMDLQSDYRLRVIRGHVYDYYPIATPVLVAPVVWLANRFYALAHPANFYAYLSAHAPDDRTARLEKLAAAFFVALAAVFMYLVARTKLSIVASTGIALMFGFSTSMWSTASRALWQHGPSALLLAMALYLLVSASDKPAAIFCTGLVLGAAYLIRPTNSLSVAFIGLYFLVNRRAYFWLFVAGTLLVLLPFVLQNWVTYGNALPPYSYQLFERLGTPASVGEALAGTLISPSRGLFVFTPLFVFSIYGACLVAARRGLTIAAIEPYLIAIVVSHWITTSLFEDWGGAWSIGPRYFVDIIPYLVYFLIPVLEMRVLVRPALTYAFAASVVLSTLIQFHCAVSNYPFQWNGKPQALVEAPGRKWDWGDMQFLRGFCPGDALEGRAPACWLKSGI